MKTITFRSNIMAWIATVVAITFSSSTLWAQSRAYSPQAEPPTGEISSVTFVVEHARRADVDALTDRYEKHTTATVMPIVVTQEQANQMGLAESRTPSTMDDAETSQYSERELAARNVANFEGGDIVVAVSLGGLLLVVLVVILVVILLD